MPLRIETFRNDIGGSAIYKALSHPLAAEPARALIDRLAHRWPVAIYDPDGLIDSVDTFYPLSGLQIAGMFVQNIEHIGKHFRGHAARPVTELGSSRFASLFVASFDEKKPLGHIRHLVPPDVDIHSLAALKLPDDMLTDRARY